MRAQRAPRDAVDTTNPLAPRAGHLMVVAGNRGNARDQGSDAGDAAALEVRDLAVHGDSEGPSFGELINRGLKEGKTMDDVYLGIIGSAPRSNADVDAKYAPGQEVTP